MNVMFIHGCLSKLFQKDFAYQRVNHHDITEILLKVAFNIIPPPSPPL
jgi:hypothetical protein